MKKLTTILLTLALLTSLLLPFENSVYAVSEMEKDSPKDTALRSLENSDDFQITYIGNDNTDWAQKLNENGVYNKKSTDTDKILKSNKKFKSLLIEKDKIDNYTKEQLDSFLDEGYSIYFLGINNINYLTNMFIPNSKSEEIENQKNVKAVFITKNKLGEYFTGSIESNEVDIEDHLVDTLLTSIWNRRNDRNSTKHESEKKFASNFITEVKADDGDSFSIGSDWECVYGWNQSILSTDFGDYTEWRAAFYLTNPIDSYQYYAMAIECAMDPINNCSANYIKYYSDADSNGQSNKLRSYSPTSSPSSSTYSFEIGGEVAEDEVAGSISASWSVTRADLTLTDSSSPSKQAMNIKFQYDTTSTYAENTSWQNCSFIYQVSSSATYCYIDNDRAVSFGRWNSIYDPDSITSSKNTKVSY